MNQEKQLNKAKKLLKKTKKRAGDNRGLTQWDRAFLANIIKQGFISEKQQTILNRIKSKYFINKDKRNHPGGSYNNGSWVYGATGSGCYMSGLDHDDMQGDWCDGPEY